MPKSESRPRTQAELSEQSRRRLVDATIEAMAGGGVGGATVRAICAQAGVSRGLLLHHFGSKEELLAEALRQLFDRVATHIASAIEQAGSDPVERLHAMARAYFTPPAFSRTHRQAFLAFWHEIRFNETVRKANSELYVDYQKKIEARIADAASSCGVALDVHSSATALVGLIDGIWLDLSLDVRTLTREEAIGICDRFIDRELGMDTARDMPRAV